MKKLLGILLIASAVFVICFDVRSPDGVGNDTWISSLMCFAIGGLLLFLSKGKKNKRGVSSNWDLSDLADAVEDKRATIPPELKSVLKDIYATLSDIDDDISAGNLDSATDTIGDIQYNFERTLFPKGPTEKQATALSRRRRKSKPKATPNGHS
jgi:hypothetical protein